MFHVGVRCAAVMSCVGYVFVRVCLYVNVYCGMAKVTRDVLSRLAEMTWNVYSGMAKVT